MAPLIAMHWRTYVPEWLSITVLEGECKAFLASGSELTWPIQCEGKAYKTRFRLDCKFHALLYEIECHERANQAEELIHPILKRGHSNALEASHNVFIRFRSKDVFLQRLHYHLSTNLALLQANLTYMHAKFGTKYHWIPEVYRRMGLAIKIPSFHVLF